MLVCERDWILLRGRLRYFVDLSALPRMKSMPAPSIAAEKPENG